MMTGPVPNQWISRPARPGPISRAALNEDEFRPTYSADGRFVTFHATRSGSLRDLYILPSAGGQRTRIVVPTPNSLAPTLSPDGRSVLYTVWGDGDVSQGAARRLAGDSGWNRTTPLFTLKNSSTAAWSPNGRWIAYVRGTQLIRADADGRNPQAIATIPADYLPFYTRWGGDSRLVYCSGSKTDGSYLIYAAPAAGGRLREVAHSEGPTYQNFRFYFSVRDDVLYLSLVDRQSDIWMAEVVRK